MLTSFFATLKGIPFIAKCLLTVLVGMMPIIEIRGAIPLGYVMGLNYWVAYLCSFIGNIIPIFFIVKYIRPLFDFFGRWKFFKKIIDWAIDNATLRLLLACLFLLLSLFLLLELGLVRLLLISWIFL